MNPGIPSSMQKLLTRDVVPPADNESRTFRYTHIETGHVTVAPDYYTFLERCKLHRRANNLDIPDDFEAQVEDQLCRQLPPEWCAHDRTDPTWVDPRFSLSDIADAMKVFAKWAVSGFVDIPKEEAERRADTCVRCYLNIQAPGCGACGILSKFVTGVFSSKKTSHDDRLKVCAVCRCLNRVQVHVPLDILASKDSAERQAKYPPFCWLKKEA